MTSPDAKPQRTRLAWLLATFFGIGYLRPGPGSWASAVTVALWWLAGRSLQPSEQWQLTAALAVGITLLGIPVCSVVARESGKHDPQQAVIDEVAGQLIALLFVPMQWKYLLAGFILFRGFDIVKPFPLRRLEKLPGGFGIMLDDVGAGLYALVVLQAFLHFAR